MVQPAACLFDLDGLLLDTEPLHARAWQEAAAAFGLELHPARLLQLRGRRRLDCAALVHSWITANGGTCDGPQALLAVRQPIAERLLARAPAMPGAEALVRRCATLALPMALATSSSAPAVNLKAAPHPWLSLITTRVHGDDPELRAGKPAPDVFLLAADRLGVDPRACWAFEDSPAGAQAAAAAGCRVHVLRSGATADETFPAGVDLLDSLTQVAL
ncbi:MAG: HAD-IA family hydrolase [Synechococcaceae cyanobacterium]|nr:HAD-IA family hydrolase [Synechococcaceae cyanobacterium]